MPQTILAIVLAPPPQTGNAQMNRDFFSVGLPLDLDLDLDTDPDKKTQEYLPVGATQYASIMETYGKVRWSTQYTSIAQYVSIGIWAPDCIV